jgi:uncharacterized protein (DUF924 family)
MEEHRNLYIELYNEWFENESYWFEKNQDTDMYLSKKYFPLIENNFRIEIDLSKEPLSVQIGIILAYDQIPRHHNRICKIDTDEYSRVAAKTTSSLIQHILSDRNYFQEISAHEWCFIMLPYRHLYDIGKIHKLITFFIEKHNCTNSSLQDKGIYKRFLKNTLAKSFKVITSKCIDNQKMQNFIKILNCHNQLF